MLRQIKMFRLDQATLDEVNQFLTDLNESDATDVDVQIVPSADAGASVNPSASARAAAAESGDSSKPYIAVFVIYTPKTNVTRANLGLGPYD